MQQTRRNGDGTEQWEGIFHLQPASEVELYHYLQFTAHPCEAAQFLPLTPACKDARFALVLEQQTQGKGRRREDMYSLCILQPFPVALVTWKSVRHSGVASDLLT